MRRHQLGRLVAFGAARVADAVVVHAEAASGKHQELAQWSLGRKEGDPRALKTAVWKAAPGVKGQTLSGAQQE